MNERQKRLVDLLELYPQTKFSRKEIQTMLINDYPKTSDNIFNDAGLHLLTKDINEINNDIECDYLIISKPSGIWLADEEDITKFLENEKKSILKRLILLRNKTFKAKRNNQLTIDIDTLDIFTKVTLR